MIRLLQLSDCHLPPVAGEPFRGRDADRCLSQLVDWLRAERGPFDHLLLTGDLVHHGGPDAYTRLLKMVRPLAEQIHWIPGNHDEMAAMRAVDNTGALGRKVIHSGSWTLLLLNSTSAPDGRGSGSLAAKELAWLQRQLSRKPQRPTLLVLHHNPAPTGSRWQDQIRLANPAELAAVIEGAPHVRGLICGHLHQIQTLQFAGRPLWSAPSTVIQFRAGREEFELEPDPKLATPGACAYTLNMDGSMEQQVLQLPPELCP